MPAGGSGGGGAHHTHHAHMVADFRRRFWVSLVLTAPVLALTPMIQQWLGLREMLHFPGPTCARSEGITNRADRSSLRVRSWEGNC